MPTNASILMRAKIFIGLLVVFLGFPCIVAGTWLIHQQSRTDALESLAERAPLVVQLIESEILAKQQSLQHAAVLLEAERVRDITQHQLDGIVSGFSGVMWAGVTDEKGKVVLAYKGLLAGADVSQRPWFIKGLNGTSVLDRHDALLLAKLLPQRADPYRFIDIAVPIKSSSGTVLGVLALHVDWIWYQHQFTSLIGKASTESDVSYVVVGQDDQLRLIKASPADELVIADHPFEQGIAQGLQEHFYLVKQAGRKNGVMQSLGWTLYVLQNKKTATNTVLSTGLFGLIAFLAGLLASTLLFLQLSRRLSKSSSEFVDALVTENTEYLDNLRPSLPQEILPLSAKAEMLITDLRDTRASLESALIDTKNSFIEVNRLVAQAPISMAMFDHSMRYMACSDLWQSIYLPEKSHPVGLSHYELIPNIPESWKLAHQQALQGETVCKKDDKWTDTSGKVFWLNWTVQPWTNGDGSIGGVIVITEDVTEANESKIALDKSEERFQLAMAGSHDGLWDWDLKTGEIYYSPSWKAMLGYQPDELEACFETWEKLVHPEDLANAKQILNAALQDRNRTQFVNTFRLAHRDGRWVSILSRGHILRDEDGSPSRMVGTHLDRTEVEALQHELSEAWVVAQAEARSNEAKSRFLATVSHEIRNPLNSICGFARLIEEEVQDPETRRYVQLLSQTTASLTLVLNGLLDFAKIEAGKLDIQDEPFDLAAMMDQLSESADMLCGEKKLGFVYSRKWARETSFLGDAGRLRQVLQNLLSNAIKFTQQGQVTLNVVTEVLDNETEQVTIQVRDTGMGIPDDRLDKLFKPFSQLHISSGNQFGGTGLGLSIVKSLTDLMRGQVVCKSVEGQGTEFSVVIPFKTSAAPVKLYPVRLAEAGPRRILIADDSPINLKILSAFLSKRGHQVVSANDGNEALTRLQESGFDYVLLDMDMPGYSGQQVVNSVRSTQGFNTASIFACLSGHADKSMIQNTLEGGFNKYFVKPVNLDDLLDFVR